MDSVCVCCVAYADLSDSTFAGPLSPYLFPPRPREEATFINHSSATTERHSRRSEKRKTTILGKNECSSSRDSQTRAISERRKNPVFWKISVFFFLLSSTSEERSLEYSLKEQQHGFSWKMPVFVLLTSCCCPVDGWLQQQLPILYGRSCPIENGRPTSSRVVYRRVVSERRRTHPRSHCFFSYRIEARVANLKFFWKRRTRMFGKITFLSSIRLEAYYDFPSIKWEV